jgi:hypothetical protein
MLFDYLVSGLKKKRGDEEHYPASHYGWRYSLAPAPWFCMRISTHSHNGCEAERGQVVVHKVEAELNNIWRGLRKHPSKTWSLYFSYFYQDFPAAYSKWGRMSQQDY